MKRLALLALLLCSATALADDAPGRGSVFGQWGSDYNPSRQEVSASLVARRAMKRAVDRDSRVERFRAAASAHESYVAQAQAAVMELRGR